MLAVDELPVVLPDAFAVPPTQLSELRAGLLLFFARPSGLQTWAELFGHEWRHVGITVQTPNGLMIASYGPRKCFRLDDPFEIMTAYTRVGVGAIFNDDVEVGEVERICRTFEQLERSDSPYTFSCIFFGPLHLYARKCRPGLWRSFLFMIIFLYCRLQQARYRDRTAFACSTFVWALIDEVRTRSLRVPLSAHPEDEAAYATPSTARDELYARWLCGPTELWHALATDSRCELDLANLNPDQDNLGVSAAGASDDVPGMTASAILEPPSSAGNVRPRFGRLVTAVVAVLVAKLVAA